MLNLFKALFRWKQAAVPVLKSSITPAELSRAEASGTPAPPEPSPEADSEPSQRDIITVPLSTIVNRLPEAIQSVVRRSSCRTSTICLPSNMVVDLLKRGSVKLTVKQLRALASDEAFLSTNAHDDIVVELPLNEILSRVRPEQLARPAGRRRVAVPEDTPHLFGPTGSVNGAVHISASAGVNRAPSAAAAADRAMCGEPDRSTQPTLAKTSPQPPISAGLASLKPESVPAETLKIPMAASKSPGFMTVSLSRLLSRWPEMLRGAIERAANDETVLRIPLSELEPGIRRGKVVFAWKQIRPWIVPTLSRPLDEYDVQPVELPLSEIAPIFMSRRGETQPRASSATPLDIPDLFAGGSKPAGNGLIRAAEPLTAGSASTVSSSIQATALPAPVLPAATSITLSSPTPARSESHPGLGRLTGGHLDPARMIEYACGLPGVGGVLISTEDGLVIAAKLPDGPAAETLAGFTPQLHQRVAQYTRDIGLSDPSHVTFQAQDRSLMILKITNGYLVVVGRAGQSLPEPQIKTFAESLNRVTPKE